VLVPNQVLLIPPYWFYSIKILEPNTLVFYNTYRTYAGTVAIIPELFMQLLQQDNLKLNITKHFANSSIVKDNDEQKELKDNDEQKELKDTNEQKEFKDNNEQKELKEAKDNQEI